MPTLTYDLNMIAPAAEWRYARAWIECSVESFKDASGELTMGGAEAPLNASGAGSVDLVATVTGVKYQLVAEYTVPGRTSGPSGKGRYESGWFSFTAAANLKDLATVDTPGPASTPLLDHIAATSGAHVASAINYAGGTSALPASTVEAALDALDLRTRYGTGSPEGVVTAPVGTIFRNTENGGYNGARVWRKDSGTGNTDWVVSEGDTGWRALVTWDASGAITSGALATPADWAPWAGAAGGIWVRRVGNVVEWTVSYLKALTPAPASNVFVPPQGFAVQATVNLDGTAFTAANAQRLPFLQISTSALARAASTTCAVGDWIGRGLARTEVSANAWPSSLPGISGSPT